MTDLYIYRYQILIITIILIVALIIIFTVFNWFNSVKASYRIKDGMPVITFDQPGHTILNKLKYLQKSRDFKDKYMGVIFEENVYENDELGNEHIQYKKIFTLSKDKLLKLNIDRLVSHYKGNHNDVVIYIATNLSEVRFEEV